MHRLVVHLLALSIGCSDDAAPSLDAGPPDGMRDGRSRPMDAGSGDARVGDGGGSDAPVASDGGASDGGRDGGSLTPCSDEAPCERPDTTCEGVMCGGSWYCVPRFCGESPSVTEYCGCDGVTFTDQPTCVRRPHSAPGRCPVMIEGTCDPDLVRCDAEPPVCNPIIPTVPAVDPSSGCWTGECIPAERCGCATTDDCPMFTGCNEAEGRCLPFRL